jgi:hypothetical protein
VPPLAAQTRFAPQACAQAPGGDRPDLGIRVARDEPPQKRMLARRGHDPHEIQLHRDAVVAAQAFEQFALRRNGRNARAAYKEIGEPAAQVVIEAQNGSRTLRTPTDALTVLTLVKTGFIVYSALK